MFIAKNNISSFNKKIHIIVLGCGSSSGVPTILGHWGQCQPTKENKRTRSSIYGHISFAKNSFHKIYPDNFSFLIDGGPDLRYQCLREKISNIDGLLCTHGHYDHVGGLEDLKYFALKNKYPLPVWCTLETFQSLRDSMPHIWCSHIFNPWEKISIDNNQYLGRDYKKSYYDFCNEHFQDFFNPQKGRQPFLFPCLLKKKGKHTRHYYPFFLPIKENFSILPMEHNHYNYQSTSLGFHFGSWAYSTDIHTLEEENIQDLKNIPLWIVDCLSIKPNISHGHLEKILSWIHTVKAKKAILTHMGIEMDYQTLKQTLPQNIIPAYDGLSFSMNL